MIWKVPEIVLIKWVRNSSSKSKSLMEVIKTDPSNHRFWIDPDEVPMGWWFETLWFNDLEPTVLRYPSILNSSTLNQLYPLRRLNRTLNQLSKPVLWESIHMRYPWVDDFGPPGLMILDPLVLMVWDLDVIQYTHMDCYKHVPYDLH